MNADIEIAGKTDPGCVRDRNEDSLAIDENIGLMVVADGMGGHNSGEVASALATDTILEFARKLLGGSSESVPEDDEGRGLSPRARQLAHCVRSANTVIFEKSRAFPKDHGMGTTVVAAVADPNSITVAHVGDSRFYLYRNGSLQRLTEDHSLVMDQVRHGLITPEQAEKSHLQNILTRALGTEAQVKVDVGDHPMKPGDLYLLCTDGLTKMMTEEEIGDVLERASSPSAAVDEMVRISRDAGAVDNVTVVVARMPKSRGVKGFFSKLFGGG